MIKFLAVFTIVFCFFSEGYAQKNLSDYSFVVVPEKFDFLDEKDKYQLNSLTKFLFNKHGFNAFFDREMPDVRRCDGLWAEVDGVPAWIRTKVQIILKDCNGMEVYRSEVGTSKLKAYNKTYSQALRVAFLSIQALNVNQTDIETFGGSKSIPKTTDELPLKVKEVIPNPISDIPTTPKPSITESTLVGAELLYTNEEATFLLRENKKGYTLFEKNGTSEILKGTLILEQKGGYQFMDTSGNTFPAYFEPNKNFVIETSFQRLEFKLVTQ